MVNWKCDQSENAATQVDAIAVRMDRVAWKSREGPLANGR
jgi:hypothetical protein